MKALNRLFLLYPILCSICGLNPTLAQIHDFQRVFDCFLLFEQHSLKAQYKDIGWRIVGTRTEIDGIDVDSNSVNYSAYNSSHSVPPSQIGNQFEGGYPVTGIFFDTLTRFVYNGLDWDIVRQEKYKLFYQDGYPCIDDYEIEENGRRLKYWYEWWFNAWNAFLGEKRIYEVHPDSMHLIEIWEGISIGSIRFERQLLPDTTGTFTYRRENFVHDFNWQPDSIRYSRYDGTSAFHDSAMAKEHDASGNIIRYSTYSYDSTILAWLPRKTITSEYEEDRPLLITEYIGNASGIPVKQTRFNYSNKRLLSIEEWKWDLTKTEWIPVANSIYQYSPSGKLESKANQYFESGTWKFKDKLDFESDGWGNVIQARYYQMESGIWKHHLTHFYHYEAYSTKGMGLNPRMPELVIYPNPSVNKFTCKNPYAAKGILFVSSLDGKEMLQLDFSASDEIEVNHNLPPGMYVVVIDSEGKRYTDRLVVR